VKVRYQQVIDADDACVVHRQLDAGGVAAIGRGPAGVDKERRAGGGDEQRGLAAFDIDGVDEQVPRRFGLGGCGLRLAETAEDKQKREDGEAAVGAAEIEGAGSGGDSHLEDSVPGLHIIKESRKRNAEGLAGVN